MQINDKNADRRLIVILSLAFVLLEIGIAPNVSLGNGRINFAFVYSSLIALMFGGRTGVLAGFLSGLVFDFSTTGPVGLMAFLLSLSSYILGIEVRNRLLEDMNVAMRNCAIMCVAVNIFYGFMMFVSGATDGLADALIMRSVPTALVSFIVFVLPAVFFSRWGSHGPDFSGSSFVLKNKRGIR